MRRGLPTFTLVGLPDRAVREARERVRAALLNSGLDFPQQRLTVNLAPAHVRKAGPGFDLAIAVGVLAASGQVPQEPLGEYAAVRRALAERRAAAGARGARRRARRARAAGYAALARAGGRTPREAALVDGVEVSAVTHRSPGSRDLLHGRWLPEPRRRPPDRPPARRDGPDLADVRGQEDAKRALEIAAAGGHNLLMVGPPGAGKTMLARRLPGILPPPTFEEALEITRIHSAAGLGDGRPRHASAPSARRTTRSRRRGWSAAAAAPRPGRGHARPPRACCSSTSCAEFSRAALDALRQPLEEGRVEIMRGQRHARVPGASDASWRPATPVPARVPAERCTLQRDRARPLPAPPERPAARPDRPGLPGRAGARRSSCRRAAAARRRSAAGARARDGRARERQRRRLAGTGALCNGDMDGRLTRRDVPVLGGASRRLLAARRAARAERPRPRPRPAGGAHDRRPRRPRRVDDGRPRRGARLPARPAWSWWRRERACDACLRRALPDRGARRPASPALLDRPRQARCRACSRCRRAPSSPPSLAGRARRRRARALRRARPRRRREPLRRRPAWARSAATPAATRRRCASSPTRRRCCSWRGDREALASACGRARGRDRRDAAARRPYGPEMAHALGRGLGAAGVPVVSGLALGIDADRPPRLPRRRRARRSRCSPAGPTLPTRAATAACTSRSASAGVVVSELPPGQRPFRWSFPARNRIMAGLARMTVVVEAAERRAAA